jgi:hypothetical protein
MFSMSLKSVPGTLVLIAPSRIGVPVALTPGLVPQADVASAGAALLEVAAGAEEAAAELVAAGALDDTGGLLVVELELHAARTPSDSAAAAAAAAPRVLQRKDLFMCSAFWWLTEKLLSSERVRGFAGSAAIAPGASRRSRRSHSTSKRCFFALLSMVS